VWRVPYLPIDPSDLGRSYEAVVRVNSQSGKGGVAYLMWSEHGLDLPRGLQIEFSTTIQDLAERSGSEVSSTQMWDTFRQTYLPREHRFVLQSYETRNLRENRTEIVAQLRVDEEARTLHGVGNGPIDAFVDAISEAFSCHLVVHSYSEHSLASGADAAAVAYVELGRSGSDRCWGVGEDGNTVSAALRAVLHGYERLS
jgi:2-isopropylmalate synthase